MSLSEVETIGKNPPDSGENTLTGTAITLKSDRIAVKFISKTVLEENEKDLFGPHSVDISQIVDDSSGSISRLTKQWNLKPSSWLGVIHGRRCFLSSLYQEGGSQYTEEDVPR
ncbi:hypothetical protein quinque_013949 [Culex quinquefasciatus]